MNRPISNRRIDRAQSLITRDTAHCWSTRYTGVARFNWHNDQRSARLARRNQRLDPTHDGWEHGVHASHAVSLPTDPLHTQWLSSTLTPWEYQHLVRRSQANSTYESRWEQMEANLADNADDTGGVYPDPDWWLRVASEIEDDFLYRHLAPMGAD